MPLLLALALLLAACGSGGEEASDTASDSGSTGQPEATGDEGEAEPTEAMEPVELRIGWQPVLDGAPFFLSVNKGFFADEGLDVESLSFDAGPALVSALASGSIDMAFMSAVPASSAIAAGEPVTVFGVLADSSAVNGLVVQPDSGIESIADLAGRDIGILRGAANHFSLSTGLANAGLSLDDVNIVDIPPASLLPAFAAGDIEGAWYWSPWVQLMVAEGGEFIANDIDAGVAIGSIWLVRNEWLEAHEDAFSHFFAAIDRANAFLEDDLDEAISILAAQLELDEAMVADIAEDLDWAPTAQQMDPDWSLSMHESTIGGDSGLYGELVRLAEFQKSFGFVGEAPDFTQYMDPGPLRRYLDETGG